MCVCLRVTPGAVGFDRDREDSNRDDKDEISLDQKPREKYIPPPPPEDEDSIFKTLQAGINFSKYDEIPVEVTGRGSTDFIAINTFDEAGLFETLRTNIEKSSYLKPTPIQKYALPIILGSRDVMACAQTGSGKTVGSLENCAILVQCYIITHIYIFYVVGCLPPPHHHCHRERQLLWLPRSSHHCPHSRTGPADIHGG